MTIEFGGLVLVERKRALQDEMDLSPAGPTMEVVLMHNHRPVWFARPLSWSPDFPTSVRVIPHSPHEIAHGALVVVAIEFMQDQPLASLLADAKLDPSFIELDGVGPATASEIHTAAVHACSKVILTAIGRGLADELRAAGPGLDIKTADISPDP